MKRGIKFSSLQFSFFFRLCSMIVHITLKLRLVCIRRSFAILFGNIMRRKLNAHQLSPNLVYETLNH